MGLFLELDFFFFSFFSLLPSVGGFHWSVLLVHCLKCWKIRQWVQECTLGNFVTPCFISTHWPPTWLTIIRVIGWVCVLMCLFRVVVGNPWFLDTNILVEVTTNSSGEPLTRNVMFTGRNSCTICGDVFNTFSELMTYMAETTWFATPVVTSVFEYCSLSLQTCICLFISVSVLRPFFLFS